MRLFFILIFYNLSVHMFIIFYYLKQSKMLDAVFT